MLPLILTGIEKKDKDWIGSITFFKEITNGFNSNNFVIYLIHYNE